MTESWTAWLLAETRAHAVLEVSLVQSLWGGYGELLRVHLLDAPRDSVILKRILPPGLGQSSFSDRRKRRSYQVELAWYQHGAPLCTPQARVAQLLASRLDGDELNLLLEDLAPLGFHPSRPPQAPQREAGIRWLAYFHARFFQQQPAGLSEQGGYWHLQTRPEEWERMPPSPWKDNAQAFDLALRQASYQSLVHGDSKPANFLWNPDDQAAAVDFQYVGPGCGIRDVAYFLDCCFGESLSDSDLDDWLGLYFYTLKSALKDDIDALELEWRTLFPVAWSDYQRFYLGWRPGVEMGAWSRLQLERALFVLKGRV